MSKLGTAAFVGKSGDRYEFSIYPIDVKMKEGLGGVYVVTARKEESATHHNHHKIFIGSTEDFSSIFEGHEKQAGFDSEGANCICVHPVHEEHLRKRILDDLLENYTTPLN